MEASNRFFIEVNYLVGNLVSVSQRVDVGKSTSRRKRLLIEEKIRVYFNQLISFNILPPGIDVRDTVLLLVPKPHTRCCVLLSIIKRQFKSDIQR